MSDYKINFNDEIKNQVLHRYSNDVPGKGELKDNALVQYYLGEKYSNGINSKVITEHAHKVLGMRKVPTSRIIKDYLGITISDMKIILRNIKKFNYDLVLLGFGGTGTSFMYWVGEFAKECEISNVFNSIEIWDGDTWRYHNLPRLPFIPKIELFIKEDVKKVEMASNENWITSDFRTFDEFYDIDNFDKNKLYYGAPDINFRREMFDRTKAFYAASHFNNEAFLKNFGNYENIELMNEGYGTLRLHKYHQLQIQMVFAFLEHISENDVITFDEDVEFHIQLEPDETSKVDTVSSNENEVTNTQENIEEGESNE